MMNYTIQCCFLSSILISLWRVHFKSYVDIHDSCNIDTWAYLSDCLKDVLFFIIIIFAVM